MKYVTCKKCGTGLFSHEWKRKSKLCDECFIKPKSVRGIGRAFRPSARLAHSAVKAGYSIGRKSMRGL
jgi:hypothetical protein